MGRSLAQLYHMGAFPQRGTRSFYLEARAIAFRISTSLMIGLEDGPEFNDMSQLLHTLFAGALDPLQLNLPFTPYGKAKAVRPLIDRRLRATIVRHREMPTSDVLSLLLQARDEQGQLLSDEQLLAHLKLLLFAGYDTASSALASGILELLQDPDLYEQARAAVRADTAGSEEPLTVEEL